MMFALNSSREAPPRTAEVSGSGSRIAAGCFILRTVETMLRVVKVTGSTSVAPALDAAAVTAADMVAGHVRLDISCLDRLYLTGFVARLQTPGAVVYFFHDHRGKPIVPPALFEPIGEKFRRNIQDCAPATGV